MENLDAAKVEKIHRLLVNSNYSLREIQRVTEVSLPTIIHIKNGKAKKYLMEGYRYPLRPNRP